MFWDRQEKQKIHLVGIGGSGMSGIAEVLLASGFEVSGSDLAATATTERLGQLGARVYEGHLADHLNEVSCVVISSAVSANNPEWQEARRRGIPVIQRAEMLAELMRLKRGVAVAGSHGKTTTTSMLGQILKVLKPTVVVGGRLQHWNASSIVGRGSIFVIEADESDRSFLKFSPIFSVVTNVDLEHLDTYRNIDDIKATFLEFLNRTAFFGMNWINADCPNLRSIRSSIVKPTMSFGFSELADLRIGSCDFLNQRAHFRLFFQGEDLGIFDLPVVGRHNVLNAAGAVGVALSLGMSARTIRQALKNFVPADRRMQRHGENERWAVLEDYAHHPVEIEAALESVQISYPNREILIFFQPHRYSRTEILWDDFIKVLNRPSHRLWLMPIYSAHESVREGVSSKELGNRLTDAKVEVLESLPDPRSFAIQLDREISGAFVVLVLGAAPLTDFAKSIAGELEKLNFVSQRLS
jgi:UDP-N-acetylmuramate--alanine ligase